LNLFLLSWLVAFPAVAAQRAAHLPLWKIEGTTNQVFLLGSLHLLSETNIHWPRRSPRLQQRAGRRLRSGYS
jgi:uncharacterized protein YbaP (TraB family)